MSRPVKALRNEGTLAGFKFGAVTATLMLAASVALVANGGIQDPSSARAFFGALLIVVTSVIFGPAIGAATGYTIGKSIVRSGPIQKSKAMRLGAIIGFVGIEIFDGAVGVVGIANGAPVGSVFLIWPGLWGAATGMWTVRSLLRGAPGAPDT